MQRRWLFVLFGMVFILAQSGRVLPASARVIAANSTIYLPFIGSLPTVSNDCVVSKPPAELKLDPFYTKFCSMNGIPIISSGVVPDAALQQTWEILNRMLTNMPEVTEMIVRNSTRVGIISEQQVTTDMPEYRDLYTQFPGTDWDTRARGLGATPNIPLSSGAEENILCYPSDRYQGENIMVHEFGHTIKIMGLEFVDRSFFDKVDHAYQAALSAGLWANTYAATDSEEYWAEGVQSYFNTNIEADPPNGIHNFVNTRAELQEYDPALYSLIHGAFGDVDWTPTCP